MRQPSDRREEILAGILGIEPRLDRVARDAQRVKLELVV
jgi:hypothetical protein